ncbi:hypothetical protein ACHAPT_011547 [Fusarium lateritium]
MPLLYGEGGKSFVRLQEQILRQEEDYSILAWTPQGPYAGQSMIGCLASSPSQFATEEWLQDRVAVLGDPTVLSSGRVGHRVVNYGGFRSAKLDPNITMPKDPPQLTARGVRVSLPTRPDPNYGRLAWVYYEVHEKLVCVSLRSLTTGPTGIFARVPLPGLISIDKSLLPEFELTELFLYPSNIESGLTFLAPIRLEPTLRLELLPTGGYNTHIVSAYPNGRWKQSEYHCMVGGNDYGLVLIECTHEGQDTVVGFEVSCGTFNENPWCWVNEVFTSQKNQVQDSERIRHSLRKAFSQLEEMRRALPTISDRAVKLSAWIPGMVVSAAIRRMPAYETGIPQLALRVTVGEMASCDGWVQVYAKQRKSSWEGKAGTRDCWAVRPSPATDRANIDQII